MIPVPTHADLNREILADIEGTVGQTSPLLPKAFIRVLSKALTGVLAGVYRVIAWTFDQLFPATASLESLARHGAQYGLGLRPAVAAVLDIQIVGTPGSQIVAGTVWRGTNGLTYAQRALAEIAANGITTARIECLTAGADGSLGIGNTLDAASPVSGVDGASVTAIQTEGEDAESTEEFRARILQRIAGQPQGGSAADYIRWAMEIPGVVKAFAFRTNAGEVTVYPLMATTGPERLPSVAKLAEALSYVSSPARRPLCATILTAAMTERVVNITITTLTPSDATTKAAILAELTRYLYAAYPKQYPDEENPTNVITVAAIWAAILAAGASAASVTMTVVGTGAVTSYQLADSEIVKLGAITWA